MLGKIFINYRRGDEPGFAGRLFDRLEQAFKPEQLFMDVDSIAPGHDFVRVLEDQVGQCDVLLTIIGPDWVSAQDEEKRRRLDDPNDFVRIEIESGLKLGKRVIPVLINNAQMPRPEELPDSLKPLARRNAVRLTHERFRADAQGLTKVLEIALDEATAARRAASDAEAQRAAIQADLLRRKEEEARQATLEQAKATPGLSPQDIAKAEELANWEFIKARNDAQELRNHVARYPNGVTQRIARATLEDLIWASLGKQPDYKALTDFLAEFPDGRNAAEAGVARDRLVAKAEKKKSAKERERQETEAWAAASAMGDVRALEAFLKMWPDGSNAKAARVRIREVKGRSGVSRRAMFMVGSIVITIFVIYAGVSYWSYHSFDLSDGRYIVGTQIGGFHSVSTASECHTQCAINPLCVAFEVRNNNTLICFRYSAIFKTGPDPQGGSVYYSGIRRW